MTTHLKKAADIEDRSTGEHMERYEYLKANGTTDQFEIRPSEARNLKIFKNKLLDHGAALPVDAHACLQSAIAMPPEVREVWESQAGWRKNRSGFVLPNGFVGSNPENIRGVKSGSRKTSQGATMMRGTSKKWRSSVGKVAAHSSYMMTAICAAFAAPLLSMIDRDPFTICFSGPSRLGKTSITLAAASVIGISRKQALFSWNRTLAQLEEEIPRFNDCMFPIDDLEAMSGKDSDRYYSVRELSYKFADGNAKARHSSFDNGNSPRGSWRSILLTSNEVSIAKLAANAKDNRKQGELTRLIDIPLEANAGRQIFDRSSDASDEDWRRRHFKTFYKGCRLNHGRVFSRYIEKLSRTKKPYALIERRMEFFRNKILRQNSHHLAREMAGPFSLLYAAGRLARDFDLVPWSPKDIRRAISVCYRAAIKQIPDDLSVQANAIKKLQLALKGLPSESAWLKANPRQKGFRNDKICVVERGHFDALFESNHERGLVMEWLKRRKRIEIAKSKTDSLTPKIQAIWPDGVRRRSLTIHEIESE